MIGMTALKELEQTLWKTADRDRYLKAIEQALTKLERLEKKETPMKVVIIDYVRCPKCNEIVEINGVTNDETKNCYTCGQALDWSDSNE